MPSRAETRQSRPSKTGASGGAVFPRETSNQILHSFSLGENALVSAFIKGVLYTFVERIICSPPEGKDSGKTINNCFVGGRRVRTLFCEPYEEILFNSASGGAILPLR